MKPVLPLLLLTFLLTGCYQKYYIVRHAEKAQESICATMQTAGNPPLSEAGQQRAKELAKRLKGEKIGAIYSTNTIRTKETASPTAGQAGLTIQTYGRIDSSLINQLKALKTNTLIVGHSTTVDALDSGLTGQQLLNDLPDTAYDNLYIITKKGKRLTLVQSKYGQPSPQ